MEPTSGVSRSCALGRVPGCLARRNPKRGACRSTMVDSTAGFCDTGFSRKLINIDKAMGIKNFEITASGVILPQPTPALYPRGERAEMPNHAARPSRKSASALPCSQWRGSRSRPLPWTLQAGDPRLRRGRHSRKNTVGWARFMPILITSNGTSPVLIWVALRTAQLYDMIWPFISVNPCKRVIPL